MGDRQTFYVMWIWILSVLAFFLLIGYRFVTGGLEWLLHSSESLIAFGIIALSSYSAVMFSQIKETVDSGNKRRDREHQEMLETTGILHTELVRSIRSMEMVVDNIDGKVSR